MFWFIAVYVVGGLLLASKMNLVMNEGIRRRELPPMPFMPRLMVLTTLAIFWPVYICYCLLGFIFKF